jgi:hypothetical protein
VQTHLRLDNRIYGQPLIETVILSKYGFPYLDSTTKKRQLRPMEESPFRCVRPGLPLWQVMLIPMFGCIGGAILVSALPIAINIYYNLFH